MSAVVRIANHRSAATRRAGSRPSRTRPVHPPENAAVLYSTPLPSLRVASVLRTVEPGLQFHVFDAAYVQRLCAGDRHTQEHFVGYFTELLQLKLRSRLASAHAVDDVRQETFARVFAVLRKDGGLRQPERLGPFVNTVCNHVLLEHYRASSRAGSLEDEGVPEPVSRVANALDVVSSAQIKDKVRTILLDLPPRDRALLNAVFLDERDRDEVCREFSVDRDYLRVLLHRAKQEFKTEYIRRVGDQTPLGASA